MQPAARVSDSNYAYSSRASNAEASCSASRDLAYRTEIARAQALTDPAQGTHPLQSPSSMPQVALFQPKNYVQALEGLADWRTWEFVFRNIHLPQAGNFEIASPPYPHREEPSPDAILKECLEAYPLENTQESD